MSIMNKRKDNTTKYLVHKNIEKSLSFRKKAEI